MDPWTSLLKVVRMSDIVVEIVDARFPETRSKRLEDIIWFNRKRLLVVLNKIDLVPEKPKTEFLTFCSRTKKGKHEILEKLRRMGGGKVGVVGFPNTGKSSFINAMVGRHSARTSPVAGFTKGPQYVKFDSRLSFLDTPGVVPSKKAKEELALSGIFNPEDIDPVISFYQLLPRIQDSLKKKFGELPSGPEQALEKIALKLKMLKKGGELDLNRAASYVIFRWQRGKPL